MSTGMDAFIGVFTDIFNPISLRRNGQSTGPSMDCFYMPSYKLSSFISGVYIIVVMGLSSLSVVFSVIVGYIHHQGLMDREVPDWLRKFSRRLNRFVLVHPRRRQGSQKDPSTTETTPDPKQSFTDSFTSLNLTFKNDTGH